VFATGIAAIRRRGLVGKRSLATLAGSSPRRYRRYRHPLLPRSPLDTTGSDNTALGDDHTYIRNINSTSVSGGGTDTVTVNLTTGLLGHATSSRRYKEDIKPMDNASKALFALKPVTF
jgi:hypothetical protein